jgi:hypothetical protein
MRGEEEAAGAESARFSLWKIEFFIGELFVFPIAFASQDYSLRR